jgi:CRP/FNR family transcriptional regulator
VNAAAASRAYDAVDLRRMHVPHTPMQVPPGYAIFREGDPATRLFLVASGAIKLYKLMPDGRRQVLCFHFAGDLFGMADDTGYSCTAETLGPSRLLQFARVEGFPGLDRIMYLTAIRELVAAQEQMLLLGRKTAREKVATFLSMLSQRLEQRGLPPSPVHLPMSRADIADCLGLTIETVSRTLSQLKREKVIGLPAADQAVVLDGVRLAGLAEGGG